MNLDAEPREPTGAALPEAVLLTTEQAAARMGYAPKTLAEWRQTGEGPVFVRVSARSVRYRIEDLDRWAEERLRSSTSDPGPGAA